MVYGRFSGLGVPTSPTQSRPARLRRIAVSVYSRYLSCLDYIFYCASSLLTP